MQAGFIAYLLFLGSRGVDAFFDARPPPDAAVNYTAHNVAVLVQVRPARPACCRAAMLPRILVVTSFPEGVGAKMQDLLAHSGFHHMPAQPAAPLRSHPSADSGPRPGLPHHLHLWRQCAGADGCVVYWSRLHDQGPNCCVLLLCELLVASTSSPSSSISLTHTTSPLLLPLCCCPYTGLTIQLLLFPDSLREEGGARKRAPALPKVRPFCQAAAWPAQRLTCGALSTLWSAFCAPQLFTEYALLARLLGITQP